MSPYDTRCAVCGGPSWGAARCLAHKTDADRGRMAAATRAAKERIYARLVAVGHDPEVARRLAQLGPAPATT